MMCSRMLGSSPASTSSSKADGRAPSARTISAEREPSTTGLATEDLGSLAGAPVPDAGEPDGSRLERAQAQVAPRHTLAHQRRDAERDGRSDLDRLEDDP